MNIKIGNKVVQFREGFKPESFSEFKKTFGQITGADEKELLTVYKKLDGKSKKSSRVVKKDKPRGQD